jgi:hypothetical protein
LRDGAQQRALAAAAATDDRDEFASGQLQADIFQDRPRCIGFGQSVELQRHAMTAGRPLLRCRRVLFPGGGQRVGLGLGDGIKENIYIHGKPYLSVD